ncbi:MAG: hypothetical protein E7461_05895 [Ruminococcaceae bacterium]|nr:hypothetical protein [Oscillospiraceae bacterium]
MEKKKVAEKRGKPEWMEKTGDFLQEAWQWIYKLRSILLAVPVVAVAIKLAFQNMARLPEFVGINLQASGEYAMMIERNVAVFVPLLVTAVCLLTMFLSKKVLYPWLVSLFSLVLPLLLWITNVFPG